MRVRAEIEGHRMFGATLVQKVIAAAVGLIAVADFVLGLVHVSGHH